MTISRRAVVAAVALCAVGTVSAAPALSAGRPVAVAMVAVSASRTGTVGWTQSVAEPRVMTSTGKVECPTAQVCFTTGSEMKSGDGGSTWSPMTAEGLQPSLVDIACGSAASCLAVDQTGGFVTTDDGGVSWVRQPGPADLSARLVACPSATRCYAAATPGGNVAVSDPPDVLLMSDDGGRTWVHSDLPGGHHTLRALTCPTLSSCRLLDDGELLRTDDGGAAWAVEPEPHTFPSALTGLVCPTASNCAGFALDTFAATSIDGGQTWTLHHLSFVPSAIACSSATSCAVGGTDLTSALMRSISISGPDGGTTWLGAMHAPRTMDCAGQHCVVIGGAQYFDSFTNRDAVVTSDNGASSWTAVPFRDDKAIADIQCPSATACVAVGNEIRADGTPVGLVIATSDGGQSWVDRPVPALAKALTSVSCGTVLHCVAVGVGTGPYPVPPVVIVSGDGGTTWSAATLPADLFIVGAVRCWSQLGCVMNAESSPGAGEQLSGSLLVSADGGMTWAASKTWTDSFLGGIDCTRDGGCLAIVQPSVAPSVQQLFASADGGTTWRPSSLPGGAVPSTVWCSDTQSCTVNGNGYDGAMFITADGGASWRTSVAGRRTSTGSCGSSTVCIAAVPDGVVTTGNGERTWFAHSWPAGVDRISRLDCPTATRCFGAVAGGSEFGTAVFVIDIVAPTPGAAFVGITPARLFESRPGLTTVDGLQNATGRLQPNSNGVIQVTGRAGVPVGASAAMLTLTAVDAATAGFVTVFPCDRPRPTASSLNFAAGQTIANSALVALSALEGQVCVFTNAAIDLVADVTEYFTNGADFAGGSPARLLETRRGLTTVDGLSSGIGPRPPGSVTTLQVTGRGGVPDDAAAVVLGVTAVDAGAAGFVTVFPCGTDRPATSTVNFAAGATVANTAISKVDARGAVCLFTNVTTDLVVDVNGSFPGVSAYTAMQPARLLESRPGLTTADGVSNAIGRRPASSVTVVQVAGRAGVSTDAATAMLNVTAVDAAAAGFLTVYPCDAERPAASTLNFAGGQTVANATMAELSDAGTVCIFTNNAIDLVVDATGYFQR